MRPQPIMWINEEKEPKNDMISEWVTNAMDESQELKDATPGVAIESHLLSVIRDKVVVSKLKKSELT